MPWTSSPFYLGVSLSSPIPKVSLDLPAFPCNNEGVIEIDLDSCMWVQIYMYTYACEYAYVNVYVYMYVCMYVCIYPNLSIFIHVYVHTSGKAVIPYLNRAKHGRQRSLFGRCRSGSLHF